MGSDPEYNYFSLAPGQFRLFELEPGLWQGRVPRGKLLVVDLDSNDIPSFDVISYLWGSPDGSNEPTSIRCGGKILKTPPNLIPALTSVLHQNRQPKHQLLWIDAVCINQSDSSEKASQLSMMPRVMSMAKSVILYVNKESESTKAALRLADCLISANSQVFGRSSSFPQVIRDVDPKTLNKYRSLMPPSTSPAWKAINDLIAERAFAR